MAEDKSLDESSAPRGAFQTTQVVDAAPQPGARKGTLLVSSGLEAGRVLPIEAGGVVTVGRAAECTFAFDDASLSREHARIFFAAGEYVLVDNGSTNGTFVNDTRISAAKRLVDGDRVQFGSSTVLRFSLVGPDELAALERVYHAAIKDGLTGAFNRKYLEERLDAEIAYAVRQKTALSIAILDIDHFKKVNDTYGHPGGDAVLARVAAVLQETLRTEDVLARYGGEEFVVIARGLTAEQAVAMAERVRIRIEGTAVEFEAKTIRVTASIGVASLACCAKEDKPSLLGTADGRLYRAKEAGRNRVVGP